MYGRLARITLFTIAANEVSILFVIGNIFNRLGADDGEYTKLYSSIKYLLYSQMLLTVLLALLIK